jgi:polyisoprenyl-phosphate glycosyltransferase
MNKLLSVVVPCYNEEAVIAETHRRLSTVLSSLGPAQALDYEIVYVNDGSADRTSTLLRDLQQNDAHVRVLGFSRNFGHQIAVTAGIEHARGDAVVLIDADLQDDPEVILRMIEAWHDGYQVAYGQRTHREGETVFKRWSAMLFYRLLNNLSDITIPNDTGDFRLMDRKVVEVLLSMPERDRFVRGMVSWVGFRQTSIPYARSARFAGSTKYPLFKMLRLAWDGIMSFSIAPLRLATWVGFLASGVALCGIVYALFLRMFTSIWVPGWTALFIAVMFLGGVQLICLGVIGEYMGRTYNETKRRPLYVVAERLGFAGESASSSAPLRDSR